MKGNGTAGHLSALLTIIIWGTTFISTKILLADFQPVEILFFRFVMGLLACKISSFFLETEQKLLEEAIPEKDPAR